MPQRRQSVVISLGGSIIAPPAGIDIAFLKRFRDLIAAETRRGTRFVIVCGGGAVARTYQAAARHSTRPSARDLDWIGIRATKLNAEFLRTVFGPLAEPEVIEDPTRPVVLRRPVVIAAGWKPGASTDHDAVILAGRIKARTVINLSNVKTLCDKDPKKHKDAKPIDRIGWPAFRKIVGSRWNPGANLPFDPVAAKLAAKLALRVIIADGRDLPNLKRILNGQGFRGTVVGSA